MKRRWLIWSMTTMVAAALAAPRADAEESPRPPGDLLVGTGPGWRDLTEDDFEPVNGDPDTWVWKDGILFCKGTPIGVTRIKGQVKNFEMVLQWRHLRSAGNSGVFVWASEEALSGLEPGKLPPGGIEVQILDHGYAEQYEKQTGKKGDWFTTNGDVFAVGASTMKPFPPLSPDGSRSFPTKELTRGVNEWNHYYIRGINGEVRLWVNGEEVSGGSDCQPSSGYLCLESEGSPIEFKEIRLRELP